MHIFLEIDILLVLGWFYHYFIEEIMKSSNSRTVKGFIVITRDGVAQPGIGDVP